MQDAPDRQLAEVVFAVAVDAHHAEHRPLVRHRHDEEGRAEDAEPGDQRSQIAGHDRPVDDQADDQWDGRLAETVDDESEGAGDEAPGASVTGQGGAEDAGGGRLRAGRRCAGQRGGGMALTLWLAGYVWRTTDVVGRTGGWSGR